MFAGVKQSGVAVNAPRRLGGASRSARGRANRAAVRCEAGKDEKLPKLPKSPREQVGQAAEAVRIMKKPLCCTAPLYSSHGGNLQPWQEITST